MPRVQTLRIEINCITTSSAFAKPEGKDDGSFCLHKSRFCLSSDVQVQKKKFWNSVYGNIHLHQPKDSLSHLKFCYGLTVVEFQRGPKEFVIARRCPDMVVGDNIKTLMLITKSSSILRKQKAQMNFIIQNHIKLWFNLIGFSWWRRLF